MYANTIHRNSRLLESLPGLLLTTFIAAACIGGDASAQSATLYDGVAGANMANVASRVIPLDVGRSREHRAPWQVRGVSLTDPKVADVQVLTPELILVNGKAAGVTDLFLWGKDGETQALRVEVNLDLRSMGSELAMMFPGCDLRVEQSQNVLVLAGLLERAEQAQQINSYFTALGVEYVDMTQLPGVKQVQVQVRIAEVSRTSIRSLGVNAFGTGKDLFLGSTIGPSNGGPLNPVSIGPPEGASAGGGAPFVFNQPVNVSPAVTLFGGIPSADLEFFVQALAENQYLRILAEPNLVALSGEEASFLAGGEFPIPVVQGGSGSGGTSITIEYKEFGVGLRFRPIVLGEGNIRLYVASEVSDLTDIGSVMIQGFQVPAVVTRRADTTIEMRSGQTFAMAGLLNETSNAVVARTPGLGSLPILGSLFRSVRYKKGETELLLLVTASLVEPVSEVALQALPGSEHLAPSDWELYGMGRIEGRTPGRIPPDGSRWLKSSGLDRLRGPGAWAGHDQVAQKSSKPVRIRTRDAGQPLVESKGQVLAMEPGAAQE